MSLQSTNPRYPDRSHRYTPDAHDDCTVCGQGPDNQRHRAVEALMPDFLPDAYGFRWGPVQVKRAAIDDAGGVHINITAGKRQITIYASRTGRSFAIYSAGKRVL